MIIYLTHSSKTPARTDPDMQEWFSGHGHKPGTSDDQCQAVLDSVLAWSRKHFGNAVVMQRTPTGFGMQLLQMSLPEGIHYEPVPEYVSKQLHGYLTPQHREETFITSKPRPLYEYDARVAWLAYCRHVPTYFRDSFEHDTTDTYMPYRQGWYKCTIRVPDSWDDIGLVPGGKDATKQHPAFMYPHKPGEQFTYLLHTSEVKLLIDSCWTFTINERFLFAPDSQRGADPLRLWAGKLCEGIEGAEGYLRDEGVHREAKQHWYLFGRAIRAIGIRTIGQFFFNGEAKERITRDSSGWRTEGGKEQTGYLARFHHPEWFCAITARERVKSTITALSVPTSQLVGIKADAVFTAAEQSFIKDTGKVGSYRLKEMHK